MQRLHPQDQDADYPTSCSGVHSIEAWTQQGGNEKHGHFHESVREET